MYSTPGTIRFVGLKFQECLVWEVSFGSDTQVIIDTFW